MMEPSTSSNDGSKRSRRVLYNKKQVLDLLLGDSSEDEALYEDSGSDSEESRTRSSSSSESETGGSRSRSRSINETLKVERNDKYLPIELVLNLDLDLDLALRNRKHQEKQKTVENDNQSNHTSHIAFAPYKFSNSNHASLHRHISPTSRTPFFSVHLYLSKNLFACLFFSSAHLSVCLPACPSL